MKKTTDGVRWIRGKPYFRARLTNGERPAVLLAVRPPDPIALAERVKTIGDVLDQLRDAGRVPVSAFMLEHGQEILRRVPPEKSDVTVRHVAQCLHRLFNLAVFPARLIDHSPLPRGFLPQIVHRRAKTYLYPEEDASLL